MHLSSASIKATAALMVILWAGFVVPARAQDTSTPAASQDDLNKQLLDRIQQLEKEVQQLKAQPPAAPEPAVEPPAVNEVAPRLKLNVFHTVSKASVVSSCGTSPIIVRAAR